MSRALILLMLSLCSPGLFGAVAKPGFRQVETCFVLDTSGSMGGLIEAAKQKIWFIANEIVNAPSRPGVRLCLVAFRDRGDEYVTRHTPLTNDIDAIYRELMMLKADGGGDTPEAVNQALLEAVENPDWSTDADVLRLIFLVGDAPPHTDYKEPQYEEIAQRARARGIIINPVLCGSDVEAKTIWETIARTAHGESAQIEMSGQVERIVTPMDQDLVSLNLRLGRLIVPYGTESERAVVDEKQTQSERMDDVGVSERLAFNAATKRIVQGDGDLIEALDSGRLSLDSIDRQRLPEAVRSMTEAELIKHLETVRDERAKLSQVVRSLITERREFIESKRTQGATGFDAVVSKTIRRQLEPTGL